MSDRIPDVGNLGSELTTRSSHAGFDVDASGSLATTPKASARRNFASRASLSGTSTPRASASQSPVKRSRTSPPAKPIDRARGSTYPRASLTRSSTVAAGVIDLAQDSDEESDEPTERKGFKRRKTFDGAVSISAAAQILAKSKARPAQPRAPTWATINFPVRHEPSHSPSASPTPSMSTSDPSTSRSSVSPPRSTRATSVAMSSNSTSDRVGSSSDSGCGMIISPPRTASPELYEAVSLHPRRDHRDARLDAQRDSKVCARGRGNLARPAEIHESELSIATSDDNADDDDDDERMHMDTTMKHSVALEIGSPDVIRLEEGGLPELSFAWRPKG